MKIQAFYQHNRCGKIPVMQDLIREDTKYPILHKGIQMAIASMGAGSDHGIILKQLQEYLYSEYSKLEQAFIWKAKSDAENDTKCFERFLKWFQSAGYCVEKTFVGVQVSTKTPLPDGSHCLLGMVSLICKKTEDENTTYEAFIIHPGQSKKSLKGRKLSTNIASDLYPMVAKLSLEEKYPHITINVVYLKRDADTQEVGTDFLIGASASVNMYQITYAQYYLERDDLDQEKMRETIEKVVARSEEPDCYNCSYFDLCRSRKLLSDESGKKPEEEKASSYQMPVYTDDQKKVVEHLNGPLLVCAGPGSGKTATLIGRIRFLIEEKGIDPGFLLVVTFTNEAATELKERCLGFLTPDRLPKIATLNGFCYGILRENTDILGKNLKLLGTVERLKLIENIASVFPPLKGFKYGQEYGKNGLYKTIAGRLDTFFGTTKDAFLYRYPELGDDFIAFAKQYQEIVTLNGYITFDEQISLTNRLFKEYPEVLALYQSVYRYIMVDEYQDTNKEQVEMLYQLAAAHKNLVVVGDDDQSIYGFRNASSAYMIDFEKAFPGGQTIVLRTNFRSTSSLVDAAQSLIKNNKNRIEKQIISGRNKGSVDKKPILIRDQSPHTIDALVELLRKEGYRYSDMALLSTKNAPLEELHSKLSVPSVLAKSYLRQDSFFLLVACVMKLYRNIHDDRALYQYLKLHGVEHYLCRDSGFSLYESLLASIGIKESADFLGINSSLSDIPVAKPFQDLFGSYFLLYEHSKNPKDFVRNLQLSCDWKRSNSPDVICENMELRSIRSMDALEEYMESVMNFADDTRVDEVQGERLLLITSHDSKGREFKVVILRNDFTGNNEETRRLFYVAMTRAKEQLFILQEKEAEVDFRKEIPHEELSASSLLHQLTQEETYEN